MKRIRLLFKMWCLLCVVGLFSPNLMMAQTDVTSTYLSNAGFDESCNYVFDATAENLASANGGANIQAVSGWTIGTIGDNSAASSFEYGYAGTLNSPGDIPAQDPDGASGTGEGTLGVSVAWGGTVTYYQTVTLPAGYYKLEYKAYNSGPATYDESQVGWVPDTGTSALSSITDFTQSVWSSDVISFTLTEETTGKIQVGLKAKGAGSGSHGRIFFDDLTLYSIDIKENLQALVDSATVMYNNQDAIPEGSTVYTDLNTEITAAQVVLDDNAATISDVATQEEVIKSAIALVYDAIELQDRVATWTTIPYDVTSTIENPSFETGSLAGWNNDGGFWTQTNTAFAYKEGTYYVEKWQSSTVGGWSGFKLNQTINNLPNGIYKVMAGALNNPEGTGGAFVYANDSTAEVFSADDYTLKVVVEDNSLEIGYDIVSAGNYIAVDNFRLTYLGTDIKNVLEVLVDSATTMYNNKEVVPDGSTVYEDLNAAISAAQTVLDDAEATLGDVEMQEAKMDTAFAAVFGAIKLQERIETWTTLPYDITSLIENPSFETGTFAGWTNVGFGTQNNTSFAKTGTYYVEKWQGSGSLTGLKVSQVVKDIPNGSYTVIADAFTNEDAGGAYIYGNQDSVEVFETNEYAVEVEVNDNMIEIGFAVEASSNWVAVDDFELIYNGSKDTTLSTLTVDYGTITPDFDPATATYSVVVPVGVDSVIVSGIATNPGASVKADTVNVTSGSGMASIVVIAADGTEGSYTVNFTVADKFENAALSLAGADGNNSNVDISGLALTTLPFTIEMWIQSDIDQAANSALIYNRPGNVGLQYTSGWQSTSQSLRFMALGGDTYGSPTVTADVTKSEWHHVAVVMTDTTRTVILDGIAKTEKASFTPIDWSAGLTYLGWDSDLADRAFDGLIDEVKIWSVAKTDAEISAGKYDILNGDESGLVAYYNFDDQESIKKASDLTGGLDGVITGGMYAESNYQDLKTAAPTITLSETNVVYVEKGLKQYPVSITTSNAQFSYSISVPAGFTATPSSLTESDFTNGETTVMLEATTAEVSDSGMLIVMYNDGSADIGLDTIGIEAVAPFTRYYIKNKATGTVLGSNVDNDLVPNRVDLTEGDASQHFILRPVTENVDDSIFYIVQDVDYRYFSKRSASSYSTTYGALEEGEWKVVFDEAGGFYSLMNIANSKYVGVDDGNTGIWTDKALEGNVNAEWLLEEVNAAPKKKEVIFVTPSVESNDTITIQAIAAYDNSSMYNVTVLETSVITIDSLDFFNAADVVVMGRNIGSGDVGTAAAVWDSITSPVLSMNMWGLRGLDEKAWWTPNASCDNITSDPDTVLVADILVADDVVFDGISTTSMDWWNGMFSVFGTDDEFTSAGNGQLLAKTSDNRPLFIRWAANVEFYPEAGHAPKGDRTFIGCGNDNTEVNYFGFSDDAEAVFFAELARMASGEATVIPEPQSKDATLATLSPSAGTLTTVFDPATFTYTVELPVGTTDVPTISATATDVNADVQITDASSLSESATVTVTAEFPYISKTYTIEFTVLSAVSETEVTAVGVTPTVSASDFKVTAPLGSEIEVYDLTGQLVKVVVANNAITSVTIDAAGIYLLKVGDTVVKVVKID